MVHWQGEIQPVDPGVGCVFSSLLLSSWARYFSQPFRRTRSPSRSRNSSNAGPELSLLYMSSSELCPARQYITPTFRWKFSYMIRQRYTRFIIWCKMIDAYLPHQMVRSFHLIGLSYCIDHKNVFLSCYCKTHHSIHDTPITFIFYARLPNPSNREGFFFVLQSFFGRS